MKRAGHPLAARCESRGARNNRQYWNPYSQFDPYGPHIAYPKPPVLSSEEIARQNEFIEKMQGSPTISVTLMRRLLRLSKDHLVMHTHTTCSLAETQLNVCFDVAEHK
jgi:hypothetical protein